MVNTFTSTNGSCTTLSSSDSNFFDVLISCDTEFLSVFVFDDGPVGYGIFSGSGPSFNGAVLSNTLTCGGANLTGSGSVTILW